MALQETPTSPRSDDGQRLPAMFLLTRDLERVLGVRWG